MNMKNYKPIFKTEMQEIIGTMSKYFEGYEFPNDLLVTKSLARCFYVTGTTLIESAFYPIILTDKQGYCVMARSILEHAVDLKYIVIQKDRKINRRFINYHKLFLYWQRDSIRYEKQELPRNKREYQAYVFEEFPEIIKKAQEKYKPSDEKYWPTIDRLIKGKYQKSWTGLNFTAKVECIERLSLNSDPGMDRIVFNFRFYSQYTHPTPYSSIPHFDPRTGGFQFHYDHADKTMKMCEDFLFMIYEFLTRSFCESLPKADALASYKFFSEQIRATKHLTTWLKSE